MIYNELPASYLALRYAMQILDADHRKALNYLSTFSRWGEVHKRTDRPHIDYLWPLAGWHMVVGGEARDTR